MTSSERQRTASVHQRRGSGGAVGVAADIVRGSFGIETRQFRSVCGATVARLNTKRNDSVSILVLAVPTAAAGACRRPRSRGR